MATHLPELPPVERLAGSGADPRRGRPQVLLLVEHAAPSHAALRTVAWLGDRLGAEVRVAAVVERGPGALDELDRARLDAAESIVGKVVEELLRRGATASGDVRAARAGEEAREAEDLADGQDADLIVVLGRHGTLFGLLPASRLTTALLRLRRRPVLVVPDHRPARTLAQLTRALIGLDGATA